MNGGVYGGGHSTGKKLNDTPSIGGSSMNSIANRGGVFGAATDNNDNNINHNLVSLIQFSLLFVFLYIFISSCAISLDKIFNLLQSS